MHKRIGMYTMQKSSGFKTIFKCWFCWCNSSPIKFRVFFAHSAREQVIFIVIATFILWNGMYYYIVCFLQKIITKCSIGIGKFVKMMESRNSLGIILNESSLIFFLQFNENLMTLMSFNGFVFRQGL